MLRNRQIGGFKFVRQLAVEPFIADFACREAALIIELDGGQHATSMSDAARTAFLNGEGYSVLRFWNNDVLSNREGVLEAILSVLHKAPLEGLKYSPADSATSGLGRRGVRASDGARSTQTEAPEDHR